MYIYVNINVYIHIYYIRVYIYYIYGKKNILYIWYESACNVGDLGSIPGLGRSPGGGHVNPLQYSCLENPMDRGAWQAIVHGVARSWI